MLSISAIGVPGVRWSDPCVSMGQAAQQDMHEFFAVWLIDRRTGSAHRVNGQPLVIHSSRPDDASAELLAGRDPAVWQTVTYPLGQGVEP
jgi:hypothetical protein